MLEAVNENRTNCFGWALEKEATIAAAAAAAAAADEEERGGDERLRLRPHPSRCVHHHRDKRSFLSPKPTQDGDGDERGERTWEWWPTWNELTTHYLREIGFLACLCQFLGATVFWISGFAGLPPILDALSTPAADGVFWLPQVVSDFLCLSLLIPSGRCYPRSCCLFQCPEGG